MISACLGVNGGKSRYVTVVFCVSTNSMRFIYATMALVSDVDRQRKGENSGGKCSWMGLYSSKRGFETTFHNIVKRLK